MTAAPDIDFDAVRAAADLASVISADLGPPARGRWCCPFHLDQHPSLALTPDRRHWRCWSCSAGGDVLDWIQRREGIDLIEAVRRLDPTAVAGGARPSPATRQDDSPTAAPSRPETPPVSHDADWQAAVERIVADAEAELWGAAGRPALSWLRSRGLEHHTAARFRLGFIARDVQSEPIEALGVNHRGEPRRIWARRGITLPWVAPGECYASRQAVEGPGRWVGCNVRRLAADVFAPLNKPPKCMAFAGSARGHLYPWPDLLPTQGIRPALLVEGEIDALLAEQEAGHVVFVGTVGGASQAPDRTALVALARCSKWLLAMDHDGAGVDAAREWKERAPHKAHRVLLPRGKDLGEFVQSGGNVIQWLTAEMVRFGG